MTDYKEKLGSFADRLKQSNLTVSVPIQEVRPVETPPKEGRDSDEVIRTTIHLSASLHQKLKLYCVSNNISIKDYITTVIEREIKK